MWSMNCFISSKWSESSLDIGKVKDFSGVSSVISTERNFVRLVYCKTAAKTDCKSALMRFAPGHNTHALRGWLLFRIHVCINRADPTIWPAMSTDLFWSLSDGTVSWLVPHLDGDPSICIDNPSARGEECVYDPLEIWFCRPGWLSGQCSSDRVAKVELQKSFDAATITESRSNLIPGASLLLSMRMMGASLSRGDLIQIIESQLLMEMIIFAAYQSGVRLGCRFRPIWCLRTGGNAWYILKRRQTHRNIVTIRLTQRFLKSLRCQGLHHWLDLVRWNSISVSSLYLGCWWPCDIYGLRIACLLWWSGF